MAGNLLKAGYDVTVFDLVESAMQQLESEGAKMAGSAIEAVRGADVIISMLPTGSHVRGLYLGQEGQAGLFEALEAIPLVIDTSTIAPDDARVVSEAARQRGALREQLKPLAGELPKLKPWIEKIAAVE